MSIRPNRSIRAISFTLAFRRIARSTLCVSFLALSFPSSVLGEASIPSVQEGGGVNLAQTSARVPASVRVTKITWVPPARPVPPATASCLQGTGPSVPVDRANVRCRIEVEVEIIPGDQRPSRVDVLIGSQVMASQTFGTATSSLERGPLAAKRIPGTEAGQFQRVRASTLDSGTNTAQALVALTPAVIILSTNTAQLRKNGNVFVPVVSNGNSSISAQLYVLGAAAPIASPPILVTMTQQDAIVAGTGSATPIVTFTGNPIPTIPDNSFFTGTLTVTGLNYIAFGTRVPISATLTSSSCGTSTSTVSGTATTGIELGGTFTCTNVQGANFVTAVAAPVYPSGLVGPDGTPIVAPTVVSTISGPFTVAGETRWNLITPGAPGPAIALTLAQTVPTPSGDQEHVTITDSAGNVLYEFAPSPDKTYSVPVYADGNLFVTTHWTKSTPTRQELNNPVKPAGVILDFSGPRTRVVPALPKMVLIRWDNDAKQYTLSTPEQLAAEAPRPTQAAPGEYDSSQSGVIFSVGYGKQKVPSVSMGTLVVGPPGSEVPGVNSARRVSALFAGLRLSSHWGDIEVEYADGDKTETASQPVGGARVAMVYYQPDATGSLGLDTGPNGGNFSIKTDFTQYGARYVLPYTIFDEVYGGSHYSSVRPTLSIFRSKTQYSGRSESIGAPGIFYTTDQHVDENRYGIGIRGQYTRRLAEVALGKLGVGFELLYRDADLNSKQHNFCSFPGCPATRTFTASNSDSDSGITWAVSVGAKLEYSLTKNSSLSLEAGYRRLAETAALVNPVSTISIDRPPYLGNQSVNSWNVALQYGCGF